MKKVMVTLGILVLLVSTFFGARYARNETLYVGGGLWEPPSNWNPFLPWGSVSGTIGLVYETLFNYDPITGQMEPWLVKDGKWVDKNTYEITLRDNLKWSDGKKFTTQDVKFTFELGKKYEDVYYHNLWESLDRIELGSNNKVRFIFKEPSYHSWEVNLYSIPILPEHIWKNKSKNEIIEGANEYPVGSGMYKVEGWSQDRCIFVRNDDWWGNEVFGKPVPKRVIEIVISSNNVALGMLLQGTLDWSNFFLPGIPRLAKIYENIKTWYKESPYMLSSSTAYLFMNTKKPPMDNAQFRKAVAYAIDKQNIVNKVYENQVIAADSLGFLPTPAWKKYEDKKVLEKYGFNYSPATAKKLLDEAGYVDRNGDGWRDLPDGSTIDLLIVVPYGWTDWMESVKSIAEDLRKVGIKAEAKFPDQGKYEEDMSTGNFDMLINDYGSTSSVSPWTLLNFVANPLIMDEMWDGNFGRYENEKLFSLIKEINKTPFSEEAKLKELFSEAEEILLKEMPAIPVWHNGLWFQASTYAWENWPDENNPYGYPCSWPGQWQFGAVKILLNLKAK
ncbi:ABC transporter substrate-binding protein [Marinitoga sp. 1135]|uniref:ABC transporter substrate-binding protein n=1 Tax=unclassified Marinitoga TaxID=2640159 RepID=UPI000950991F|nr:MULTISPECIES: ABC transporter substrate-binding protein [unclassified Marinitoga]APT75912.1 ABC transporter substrate-binding protein [Marinitoga sp. 1137]NUU95658.1 ABC transporter substrate-binding protein [Marinitoga sp. 1135]NUU97579.1 ABC transporter substrate-binding protein [Marinitoga sp. 1138]